MPEKAMLGSGPALGSPWSPIRCKRREFDQNAIAGGLDDAPTMFGNERTGSGGMLAQQTRRTRLINLHQPAVADHAGREDCGEAVVHPIRRSRWSSPWSGNPIPWCAGAHDREGLLSPDLAVASCHRKGPVRGRLNGPRRAGWTPAI